MIAYVLCVVGWVAADFGLQHSDSFFFVNFMRLPLETAIDLAGSYYWCHISHSPFWSIGTLIITAYAALGFLPLILAPWAKRNWPLWLTGAFMIAHPVVWCGILAVNIMYDGH
ncbi:MAG: hypothetical protein PHU85_09455 [Phycisphaerae bacterium]|nr:hypothetical protein [Phycisphaerae bacterium]